MGTVNDIIGGQGDVTLVEALTALTAATGLAVFAKKIGLWPKLSPVERREMELLDKDMPKGMWRAVQTHVPAAVMSGHRITWKRGRRNLPASGWGIGATETHDLEVRTPILDEETGQLI